jgi:hypothetical protein
MQTRLSDARLLQRLLQIFLNNMSRDVTTHNTEDCESRVLMIERSQR